VKHTVELPTLHDGQASIYLAGEKFNVVRCPRRWGKTKMLVTLGGDAAAKGLKAGIFTPEHKQLQEPYEELLWTLQNIKRRASKTEGTIRTLTGGVVDFWSLTDNELAGRGREYDIVLVDEAAFTKNGQMTNIWKKSIAPTMLTKPQSEAWVYSTPNGIDPENFFYQLCHHEEGQGLPRFKEHRASLDGSPYVRPEELEQMRLSNHPLVFQQEYLAEFVDWRGVAFFSLEKMLIPLSIRDHGRDVSLKPGQPVPWPSICDTVFAVIDTALKDKVEHDGTAVSFFAISAHLGHKLILLDWDIISIEGALLETWLPTVYQRLNWFTTQFKVRLGNAGAFIEDKGSGTVLLQQARKRGWKAHAIDSKLTDMGKSERALNVSGYYHQELFKISAYAFDKVSTFKGATRNHWLSQVTGFRMSGKDMGADDLLDTMTYGLAIALGDAKGF